MKVLSEGTREHGTVSLAHHHVAELRFRGGSAAGQRAHHALEGVPAPEAVRENLRVTRILIERERRERQRQRERERERDRGMTRESVRCRHRDRDRDRQTPSLTIRSGSSNAAASSCGCSTASL